MKQLFILLAKRWRSKSPEMFVKLTNWSLIAAIPLTIVSLTPLGLPAWVMTVSGLLASGMMGVAGMSKITTSDETLSKETI